MAYHLWLALLAVHARALCVFTQDPNEKPAPARNTTPFPANNFNAPVQCPQYAAEGCCNSYQNNLLQSQLAVTDAFLVLPRQAVAPRVR